MPGDPFKKVFPGKKTIPAEAWNTMLNHLEKSKVENLNITSEPPPGLTFPGSLIAYVANYTGAKRDPYDVVIIDSSLKVPGNNPYPMLKNAHLAGRLATNDNFAGPYAVYIEPCEPEKSARAVIQGLAVAKVDSSAYINEPVIVKPGDIKFAFYGCGEFMNFYPPYRANAIGNAFCIGRASYGFYGLVLLNNSGYWIGFGLYTGNVGSEVKIHSDHNINVTNLAIWAENGFWGLKEDTKLQKLWPVKDSPIIFFGSADTPYPFTFCPPELAGKDQKFTTPVQLGGLLQTHIFEFEKGHLVDNYVDTEVLYSGPYYATWTGTIPEDVGRAFFPAPGNWNGMPQWQNAQNPNWWIRWQPNPANPGQGAWIIGQWPNNAQQGDPPIRGWRKDFPNAGEAPDLSIEGNFPNQIGDVDGQVKVEPKDYVVQDCQNTDDYYLLKNSNHLNFHFGQVILWKNDSGKYRCGKITVPIMDQYTVQYNWAIYRIFKNCTDCPTDDYVVQDCKTGEKYKLEGLRRYKLSEGQVFRFARIYAGGTEKYICATVITASSYDYKVDDGWWRILATYSSCEECYPEDFGQLSQSPAGCKYSQFSQLRVYSEDPNAPPAVLGIYTLGGTDPNGYCWWKKMPYVIERDPQFGWFIVNINNTNQWWLFPNPQLAPNEPGIYGPGPNATGELKVYEYK